MRILVAIANHGTKNRPYLDRLLAEYRAMSHTVHVVVLSDQPKDLGPDVEVRVGLPTSDPWSLPFGHRALFAERIADYDLFIYSEDDMLVRQENIDAFVRASDVLNEDEIAGFLRSEHGPDGALHYPEVHGYFHWVPRSVRVRGGQTFAAFSNEHAACYLLTRAQLRNAIASGGFLVAPHQERYDLLVSAATDPYTQCGMTKLICVSDIDAFTLPHLPNRYVNVMGVGRAMLRRQIEALTAGDVDRAQELVPTTTRLPRLGWSKDYYEPVRHDLLAMLPAGVRSVLSLGCGWGATEEHLVGQGVRVVAAGLDPVIGRLAEDRGVRVVYGDPAGVADTLAGERFDCVLAAHVLHLAPDPTDLLCLAARVLSPGGVVVASVPNMGQASVLWGRLRGREGYRDLGDYDRTGVQLITRRALARWAREAGLSIERVHYQMERRHLRLNRLTAGVGVRWLGEHELFVARHVDAPAPAAAARRGLAAEPAAGLQPSSVSAGPGQRGVP